MSAGGGAGEPHKVGPARGPAATLRSATYATRCSRLSGRPSCRITTAMVPITATPRPPIARARLAEPRDQPPPGIPVDRRAAPLGNDHRDGDRAEAWSPPEEEQRR